MYCASEMGSLADPSAQGGDNACQKVYGKRSGIDKKEKEKKNKKEKNNCFLFQCTGIKKSEKCIMLNLCMFVNGPEAIHLLGGGLGVLPRKTFGFNDRIVHSSAILGRFTATCMPSQNSHQIYTHLKNGPRSWEKV